MDFVALHAEWCQLYSNMGHPNVHVLQSIKVQGHPCLLLKGPRYPPPTKLCSAEQFLKLALLSHISASWFCRTCQGPSTFEIKLGKLSVHILNIQLLHGVHTSQGIFSCLRTRKNLPVECVISLGKPAVMNYEKHHTFHRYEIVRYTLNSVLCLLLPTIFFSQGNQVTYY